MDMYSYHEGEVLKRGANAPLKLPFNIFFKEEEKFVM